MQVSRARYLLSASGRAALAALPPGLESLSPNRLATELRRSFAAEEASALAEQVTLRGRAEERFGQDLGMLYSAEGLEMMTHPRVAERRALRIAALGLPVVDLTCGLGGDLRAAIAAGARAIGIEREALALLAGANAGGSVVRGEAERAPVDIAPTVVVLDPSRRSGVARRFDPAAFSPPWDVAMGLARGARAAAVKGPPGIELRHIPDEAELEFVQLGRTLRESCAWFGGGCQPGLRRAVLLDRDLALDSSLPESPAECIAPAAFIFDPESCVTRAGLVRQLAYVLGARLMDRQVAYLTAPEPVFHAMSDAFEVLDAVPFSVARLRARLRQRRWRPDEIRRRAFPVEPDELRRLLGRLEGERVTLLCTTVAGRRTVFIARQVREATEECEPL